MPSQLKQRQCYSGLMDIKYFFARFFVQLLLIIAAVFMAYVGFGFYYVVACFAWKFAVLLPAVLVFLGVWLLWKRPAEALPRHAYAVYLVYGLCAVLVSLAADPQGSILAIQYWCGAGFLGAVGVWRCTNALVKG